MDCRDNSMRKHDSSSNGLRVIAKPRVLGGGAESELWINLETSKGKTRTKKRTPLEKSLTPQIPALRAREEHGYSHGRGL